MSDNKNEVVDVEEKPIKEYEKLSVKVLDEDYEDVKHLDYEDNRKEKKIEDYDTIDDYVFNSLPITAEAKAEMYARIIAGEFDDKKN